MEKLNYTNISSMYYPSEDFVPGPLPLLSEGKMQNLFDLMKYFCVAGAMSLFTLLYVTPILGLIYYLFFWSQETSLDGVKYYKCVSIYFTQRRFCQKHILASSSRQ